MPNIPAEGVNYETLTFDSYLTIPTTGPWDFSNITAQFQESDIEMIPVTDTEYSVNILTLLYENINVWNSTC